MVEWTELADDLKEVMAEDSEGLEDELVEVDPLLLDSVSVVD